LSNFFPELSVDLIPSAGLLIANHFFTDSSRNLELFAHIVTCAGYNLSEGKCEECEDSLVVLWALGVMCVFLFLTAAYYLMTSKVTAKASVLFTTTCAFGMLISLLQSIGIIGTMTVKFPIEIDSFFGWFSILMLDLDNFGFACLAGSDTSLRYSAGALFFPLGLAWFVLNYGAPWHLNW
jgi:uncharacterized protein with PQ loop repeat